MNLADFFSPSTKEYHKWGRGRLLGHVRRRALVEAVEIGRGFTSVQLSSIFFTTVKEKDRRDKANKILKKLVKSGELNCWRKELGDPYVYYKGRYSTKLPNWPRTNEVIISILKQLSWWQKALDFQMECHIELGKGRRMVPDAWMKLQITLDVKLSCIFLEYENDAERFSSKVKNYNTLYATHRFERYAIENDGSYDFPWILVVCETFADKKKIMKKIEKDNKYRLPFRVAIVEEVKNGFWSVLKGRSD